jgi:hypothetical protein
MPWRTAKIASPRSSTSSESSGLPRIQTWTLTRESETFASSVAEYRVSETARSGEVGIALR